MYAGVFERSSIYWHTSVKCASHHLDTIRLAGNEPSVKIIVRLNGL